ncbi:MAG: hypothetical protein OM95_06780 [Bdellovibrio sp. ArHS]|uniref:DUF222 domain-containing protein n=1 Tax=Bdellovibrio sp. ArHS TaxID=1569284 RepID=UPI000582CF38|nr:DUF222 domain-containing protein [Bdellovibrio sp. ArHS]KHD88820.1 MAG: hypothetical protein OM95_06780 [Bdellovibrio sp. ArHS]
MNLTNIPNDELTRRLEKLVRTERKITHLILQHINEIESRRLYADLGYDGMFSYLTKGLGYSESSAYRRIQSARLLRQIPEVAERLENGALNLSQLTQLNKCLREETRTSGIGATRIDTKALLKEIEHKNTYDTQKVLAKEFNQYPQKRTLIKPQSDASIRLEVTLSQEDFSDLSKARSLLSHSCPDGSWSDVISTLARKFIKTKMSVKTNHNQKKAI